MIIDLKTQMCYFDQSYRLQSKFIVNLFIKEKIMLTFNHDTAKGASSSNSAKKRVPQPTKASQGTGAVTNQGTDVNTNQGTSTKADSLVSELFFGSSPGSPSSPKQKTTETLGALELSESGNDNHIAAAPLNTSQAVATSGAAA